MKTLVTDFGVGGVIALDDLQTPPLAVQLLQKFSAIINAKNACIGGGFARGLYMQQYLGLSPEMNDIDIFADIPVENFDVIKAELESEFGSPIRYHIGQFGNEKFSRGLIEFALPEGFKEACAGVDSVQLNFGEQHPWANSIDYVTCANLGINQISIDQNGQAFRSRLFVFDMAYKTATMNPNIQPSAYDWSRTVKSVERMLSERPEFEGWKLIRSPEPHVPTTGTFWQKQKGLSQNLG